MATQLGPGVYSIGWLGEIRMSAATIQQRRSAGLPVAPLYEPHLDEACQLCELRDSCPHDLDTYACQDAVDANWRGYPAWREQHLELEHDRAVANAIDPHGDR